VTLVTRRAGMTAEHGVRWESAGQGDYTLETVTREARGTEVILHLREGEDELLSGFRLRSILRKYSDHITIPILMKTERWKMRWTRTRTSRHSRNKRSRSTRPRRCGPAPSRRSPRSSTKSSTSTWAM